MHVRAELRQPSYLDSGTGIVGGVRGKYSGVAVIGVQEHELGKDLCVPGSDVVPYSVHLPMIRVVLVSDGEEREIEKVRELESHGLPAGLGAVRQG